MRTVFQSTPSGGKATFGDCLSILLDQFQSTPSGGKATLLFADVRAILNSFNPRLPGGRRPIAMITVYSIVKFQSTPSGGKATEKRTTGTVRHCVSIHAFRGEGDLLFADVRAILNSFNPRLPGGRRQDGYDGHSIDQRQFQSTPSGGKATPCRSFPHLR